MNEIEGALAKLVYQIHQHLIQQKASFQNDGSIFKLLIIGRKSIENIKFKILPSILHARHDNIQSIRFEIKKFIQSFAALKSICFVYMINIK